MTCCGQKKDSLEQFFDLNSPGLRKLTGIFYTPGAVAEAMVQSAFDLWCAKHPAYEELTQVKVLDPACGHGEFLLAALKVLLKKHLQFRPAADRNEIVQFILNNNLYGIDCNAEALKELYKRFSRLAGNDQEHQQHIIHADALDHEQAGKFFAGDLRFDVVVGNPPYVSYGLRNVGKLSRARANELRRRFHHAAEYKIALYALFMELAVNSLAPGGVHTFIVPDSFLCGQFFTGLRSFLLKNCSLEKIFLVRQKLFRAVPGNLVIYLLSGEPPAAGHKFGSGIIAGNEKFTLQKKLFMQLQSTLADNYRQRFRLFADKKSFLRVKAIEEKSVCKLGDLLTLASGLVARNGQRSIISTVQHAPSWLPGITGGKAVHPGEAVQWQGEYINTDPGVIKSGLHKVDYRQKKLLIRQTGDRIVAAVDERGLAVLNNLHVGCPKQPDLDLQLLADYLNSEEMLFYYQAVTMESGRAMAQIDLETLRELPLPQKFC